MRQGSALLAAVIGGAMLLQGCAVPVQPSGGRLPSGGGMPAGTPSKAPASMNFATIVGRVEPVAEQVCRAAAGNRNCDYLILLDNRPDRPPNAYQTLDGNGRPVLVVNQTLIDDLKDADEVAFVISHEAAHHIADHLEKQQASTYATAVAAGLAAAAIGASPDSISKAQELGAYTGSRVYSKNYEIEADSLGARIAYYAGYDPVAGVAYFSRAADPGDTFLGTHPPNAQRIAAVKRTMAQIEAGR